MQMDVRGGAPRRTQKKKRLLVGGKPFVICKLLAPLITDQYGGGRHLGRAKAASSDSSQAHAVSQRCFGGIAVSRVVHYFNFCWWVLETQQCVKMDEVAEFCSELIFSLCVLMVMILGLFFVGLGFEDL